MADKYYRVKKDTILWKEGAILYLKDEGYYPIEDIWNTTPVNGEEYISQRIVEHENLSDTFERVYQDNISGKLYRTKDELVELYNKSFK